MLLFQYIFPHGTRQSVWLVVVFAVFASVVGLASAFAQNEAVKPKPSSDTKQQPATDSKPSATDPRIAKLVEQLGHAHPAMRERAQAELATIGFAAFDALSMAAENHPDAEVSLRAAYLVRRISIEWTGADDHSDVRRLLKHYESRNFKERLQTIQRLSQLSSEIATAPLCRLVRYENSYLLSKWAAVAVIDRDISDPARFSKMARTIEFALGPSDRPGAKLLKAYANYFVDAKKSMEAWRQFVDDEIVTLRKTPQETSRQLILALLKRQFILLDRKKMQDDALAVARKMIALQPRSPENLRQFIDWLAKHKAWPVIDDVVDHFKKYFEKDPNLLYALAQARKAQGKPKLAEQVADAALALEPKNARAHLVVAYRLQESGQFHWAEREYLRVLEIVPQDDSGTQHSDEAIAACVLASRFLATMYHDQLQNQKASDVLQTLIKRTEDDVRIKNQLNLFAGDDDPNAGVKETKARAHFYLACHYQTTGNTALQAEQLSKAIEQAPTDGDVLIAMYRLPDQTPEFRNETLTRIKNVAAIFENDLVAAKEADEDDRDRLRSIACNQYAWLIANTEGDFKRALRLSKISNEIRPNQAGLLDTLGRCYYAVGDLENAIRIQSQANRLEPHTGSIARQLQFFKAEAAKKNGQGDVPKDKKAVPPKATDAKKKQADDVE